VNPVTYEILARRVKQLGNLPAMPTILSTLSDALSRPANEVDVDKVAQTISCDESLTAQCLRVANSALYRQRGDVATVREAVLTLGLWRIRDLAFSCNLPLMFASLDCAVRKECFWRHALGTAVVAQEIAQDFTNGANEQTYLAGLLHDIGILVNGRLFPEDFRDVMKEAVEECSSVPNIERRVLGFTHAESGRILAEIWKLPLEVAEAIEYHHRPEEQKTNNEITVIVNLANQWCWKSGLGYGYSLGDYELQMFEVTWQALKQKFPAANRYTCEEYPAVLESHLKEAHELADAIFACDPVAR
jgi:putative nucleotidyltransferase with HDIG domain